MQLWKKISPQQITSLFSFPTSFNYYFSPRVPCRFAEHLLTVSDFMPFLCIGFFCFSVRLTTLFSTKSSCKACSFTVCLLDDDCCLHFMSKVIAFHETLSADFSRKDWLHCVTLLLLDITNTLEVTAEQTCICSFTHLVLYRLWWRCGKRTRLYLKKQKQKEIETL